MSLLAGSLDQALTQTKTAIVERINNISGATGIVWERIRYADNLSQWLELAAVTLPSGKQVLRVVFVYLSGFVSDKVEFGTKKITATYTLEVIHQFDDGDNNENSTKTFEQYLGSLWEGFDNDNALGFTDVVGQDVENTPLQVPPADDGGKPQYVDGVLAHRKECSIDIIFRLCRGKE